MNATYVDLPDAPAIPGLRFRPFDPDCDYPEAVRVLVEAMEGDGDFWNADALRSMDAFVPWVDPAKDRIVAEVDGTMIGLGRVEAGRNEAGERVYLHSFNLLPAWRGRGIGTAVLKHNERRLREIAASHPHDGPRFFQPFGVPEKQVGTERLLLRHGYVPVRRSYEMLRPMLNDIPDCPLPAGVEVRLVEPSQLRAIWDANCEAFRDHWNSIPRPDGAFEVWCNDPFWRKELSAVAWDGDECVGMVLGLVSEEEIAKLGRRRIWTESICVRRPWRQRGVARALMARCMRLGRDAGYTEAALGVDAENLSGALGLYRSMGYQVIKQATTFRKRMGGMA